MDLGELRARYLSLSDAELHAIVFERPGDFTEEAVTLAGELLAERGVDLGRERRALAKEAAAARRVAEREAEERARALDLVLRAGREPGVCLRCRDAQPVVERGVSAVRPGGASFTVGDLELHALERVRLAIPLCAACDRADRPRFELRGAWIFAWILGVNAAGIAVAFALGAALRGVVGAWLPVVVGMGLVAVALALPVWLARRRTGELATRHPLADELARRGYRFVPDEEAGRPSLEVYASLLCTLDRAKREHAERQLCLLNQPATVARMRALLDHPEAGPHAVRVLLALRATEARPDLERLAREGTDELRDEAEAALRALAGDARPSG
ncbi:MAG: hypothetical protein IT373_07990 [Polyangiaceae bacterium]|nr:hypothetical protein [Polyangiaceae bacterium]